jgi:hypothetical protein
LEQFSFFGLARAAVLALLATIEQLTDAIEELLLPLTHLDGMDGVISCNRLDCDLGFENLYVDLGFEFTTMSEAHTPLLRRSHRQQ